MAVSLAETKNNAETDVDLAVIDEFRKESEILDTLIFDDAVNPAGGGGTLTYGYRRQTTQAGADFRKLGTEYSPGNVQSQKFTVDLAVLGGSFEVDRITAKVGPAASGAVAVNLAQKIKAARTKFQDALINGDSKDDADENGFDGLDKALSGSSTEVNLNTLTDWTDLDTDPRAAFKALDLLDEFLSYLDGTPTVIVGNKKAMAKLRAIARRSGQYTKDPIEDLLGPNGRPVVRESYGGVLFVDAGEKAGSSDPIVATYKQGNVDVAVTAESGNISFKINGEHTITVAYNAAAGTLQTAIDAVLPGSTVTKNSSTFTIVWPLGRIVTYSDATGVTIADAASTNAPKTGLTSLYAYRVGLDGFHGVSTAGGQLVQTYLPDFTTPGAVKKGEVEMGPVAVALKATKAAAVLRGIKVQ